MEFGTNLAGHYSGKGNRAALPALLRGLAGQYDGLVRERDTHLLTAGTGSELAVGREAR